MRAEAGVWNHLPAPPFCQKPRGQRRSLSPHRSLCLLWPPSGFGPPLYRVGSFRLGAGWIQTLLLGEELTSRGGRWVPGVPPASPSPPRDSSQREAGCVGGPVTFPWSPGSSASRAHPPPMGRPLVPCQPWLQGRQDEPGRTGVWDPQSRHDQPCEAREGSWRRPWRLLRTEKGGRVYLPIYSHSRH